MKRVILFLSGALIVGCVVGQPASRPTTLENRPDGAGAAGARAVLPDGAYMCSFAEDGYQYPPFQCAVSSSEGHTRLEKLGGSQRIRGEVTITGAGFHFDGEFYCPYGDCTSNVSGDFAPVSDGTYQGALVGAGNVTVELTYLPEGYAGGGGDGYGGGMYGGDVYGYGGAYYGGDHDMPM